MAGCRHHAVQDSRTHIHPKAFVNRIEEGFVLLDGTAQSAAEAVPLKLRQAPPIGGVIEKVPCIQSTIPQVLEYIAVPEVRSILAHHDRLAAHDHSVLGAEGAADDFVLADTVDSQRGSSLRGPRSIGTGV